MPRCSSSSLGEAGDTSSSWAKPPDPTRRTTVGELDLDEPKSAASPALSRSRKRATLPEGEAKDSALVLAVAVAAGGGAGGAPEATARGCGDSSSAAKADTLAGGEAAAVTGAAV